MSEQVPQYQDFKPIIGEDLFEGEYPKAMAENVTGKPFELITPEEKRLILDELTPISERALAEMSGKGLTNEELDVYVYGRVVKEVIALVSLGSSRNVAGRVNNQLKDTLNNYSSLRDESNPDHRSGSRSETVQ